MNRILCIIPCGNRKIWDKMPGAGPTKAKNVYIGPFARKCREYAEIFYPSSWCILSAKYGFLFPEDIVPHSYNVSFNDKRTNPITAVDLLSQAAEKRLGSYQKVVVLGGKNYVKMVRHIFATKAIYIPLGNCKGIGYMMEKLNKAISKRILL